MRAAGAELGEGGLKRETYTRSLAQDVERVVGGWGTEASTGSFMGSSGKTNALSIFGIMVAIYSFVSILMSLVRRQNLGGASGQATRGGGMAEPESACGPVFCFDSATSEATHFSRRGGWARLAGGQRPLLARGHFVTADCHQRGSAAIFSARQLLDKVSDAGSLA